MSEEGHTGGLEGEAPDGSSVPPDGMDRGAGSAPPADDGYDEQVQVEAAPAPAPAAAQPKQRRKIDLKSRLSTVRASGSMALGSSPSGERKSDPLAFPPPPATGSVPAPRLPGGISVPMVSSPFAPPEPEKKQTAQAQTIKVEIGEEVHAARAKASKKTAIYVAIAALVAGAMGFFMGGAQERGRQGKKIIEDADGLAADVAAANKTMSDMSDALRGAGEAIGNEEWPAQLAESLKASNVDFDAGKFSGRAISGLPPQIFNGLLAYTNDVEKLNKQKDVLKNLMSKAQKPVETFWAEKKKPVVKFGVLFTKVEKEFAMELVPMKEPFEVKSAWPGKLTILQQGEKGKTKESEMDRFTGKGNLGEDKLVVPIEPKSVAGFTDLTLIYKLRQALDDTRMLIDGQESPIPQEQTDGLLKDGKQLEESLKKVGRAGG
jgi:hypothetical protein